MAWCGNGRGSMATKKPAADKAEKEAPEKETAEKEPAASKAKKAAAEKAEKAEDDEKPAEKASEEADEAEEPAEKPAKKEPKERTFVDAKTGKAVAHPVQGGRDGAANEAAREQMHAERKGSALPFRIGAIVLWVLGIACEVVGILVMNGTLYLPKFTSMTWLIVFLVVDFAFVVAGSQLWKRANHISPASKENKLAYWVQTDLGIIIAVIAFAPIIILMLSNKNLDKKTKQVCSIVAGIALIAAVASGIDYHPTTQEDMDEAQAGAAVLSDGGLCYWTPFGEVYHFNPDCQYLKNSGTIFTGTVQDALDAHRDRGCSGCTVEDGTDVLAKADPAAVAAAAALATPVSTEAEQALSGAGEPEAEGADAEEAPEELPKAA